MDNHDRVTEGYFGELGERVAIRTRERIHWICNQVSGKTIDVGCSQGIVPLLLGREGISVHGIDLDTAAIEFAKSQLASENDETIKRIEYIYDDFLTSEHLEPPYDTAVATEFLEHFINPNAILKRIKEVVMPKGTIIITVPFGINDYIDHKKSYSFINIVEELEKYFTIQNHKLFGKWIGFVCTNESKERSYLLNRAYLQNVEDEFLKMERMYLSTVSDNKKKIIQRTDKLKLYEEEIKRLKGIVEHGRHVESNYKELKNQIKNESNQQEKYYQMVKDIKEDSSLHLRMVSEMLSKFSQISEIQAEKNEYLQNQLSTVETQNNDLTEQLVMNQETETILRNDVGVLKKQITVLEKSLNSSKRETKLFTIRYNTAINSNKYRFGNALYDLSRRPWRVFHYMKKFIIFLVNPRKSVNTSPFSDIVSDKIAAKQEDTVQENLDIAKGNIAICRSEGDITGELRHIDTIINRYPNSKSYNQRKELLIEKIRILNEDNLKSLFDEFIKKRLVDKGNDYRASSNKVLHILNSSAPYNLNGYAVRFKQVRDYIASLGWQQAIILKPSFPKNLGKMDKGDNKLFRVEEYEGHNYYYNNLGMIESKCTPMEFLGAFVEAILKAALIEKPSILHAASNYTMGVAAAIAGDILKIPVIYEVRGRWELTRSVSDPSYFGSEEYQYSVKMENYSMNQSDAVVTISESLKEYLSSGVNYKEKLNVAWNCVDFSKIQPLEPDKILLDEFNIKDELVIGYAGAIIKPEGLDTLIRALKLSVDKGIENFKVIILGDGYYLNELKEITVQLNMTDYVIFLGKVPHDEIARYYSIFDISVLPRQDIEVCRVVPPIKPFECMAFEKAVIVSDLPVFNEFIMEDNGIIYGKTDEDLYLAIEPFISDKSKAQALGKKARKWLESEHSIQTVFSCYSDIYTTLKGDRK